jgi:ribosomal protein S18 acetylase RimI-like enzyme
MNDAPVEWARDGRVISTDRARLDRAAILALLDDTHWGGDLTPDRLARAIEHSLCFGVYEGARLVGFGRVVTDLTTFGYLTDVAVAPSHRGRGLGRWLTDCMVAHPGLQGLRRLALLTRDAESLYRKAGFEPGPAPLVYLERRGAISPRARSTSRR